MKPIVWFTGLPASGKSTLARAVAAELKGHGVPAVILDSDEVRASLVPTPGYSVRGRDDFYETLARLAALLAAQGTVVVLVAATGNRKVYRERARELAGELMEVFVDTPVELCRARDPKRLYRDVVAGLPGSSAPYQPPGPEARVVRPADTGAAASIAQAVALRVASR